MTPLHNAPEKRVLALPSPERLQWVSGCRHRGWVRDIIGTVIRAGMSGVAIGDNVTIERHVCGSDDLLPAEVIGIQGPIAILAPFGQVGGVRPGDAVYRRSGAADLTLGDFLLGSVVDAHGRVLEQRRGSRVCREQSSRYALDNAVPPPLSRRPIVSRFITGIRAIDGCLTLGIGQRLAVFAEPGVGKSTLVTMLAASSSAEVNVIALIGERGREVRDLVDELMGGDTTAAASGASALSIGERTVVVISTSSDPPLERIRAALTAARIAEYFRDQGKSVLLQLDSLTRLLRAYREIGLAAGELPVRRGYPSSVFSRLPELIERAGTSRTGAITAVYTVLLSSDIDEDPLVEEIKGLTDGHLVLSRKVAERGRYPAIDLRSSISRLAARVAPENLPAVARQVKAAAAALEEQEELTLLRGGGALSDEWRRFAAQLQTYLAQERSERTPESETFARLRELGAAAARLL